MFFYVFRVARYLLLWLDHIVLTAVLYALAWLPRFITRYFYFGLFRLWCKSFVRALNVDLRVHQKNHRDLPSTFILIANHPSAFEDIGIPAVFPVHSLAKIEVGSWWIAGRISRAAGTLYVERESRDSRRAAGSAIEDALKAGISVALYPEGGCKGRRLFESFRYGAFDISLRTGVPIVPVFLHYESQADFEWTAPHTLLHKIWHMMTTQNNRANFYVYDAIDPGQFKDKEAYYRHVYGLYEAWQQRYLD